MSGRKGIAGLITAMGSLAIALIIFGTNVFAATATFTYEYTCGQTEARSMLSMINKWRQSDDAVYAGQNGGTVSLVGQLDDLTYDYNLERIAMQRAYEIAMRCAHTRPDGSACTSITYNGASSSGENIAAGQETAEDAFESWQEADYGYSGQGHRRNMLGSGWKAIGIGHVVVGNTHYWVQEFSTTVSANNTATAADDDTHTISMSLDTGNMYLASYLTVPSSQRSYGNDYTGYVGATGSLPEVNTLASVGSAPTILYMSGSWSSGETFSYPYSSLGGAYLTNADVTWTTSDSSIASIEGDSYRINGVGTATLTATSSIAGKTSTCTMTVTGKPMPMSNSGITVSFEGSSFEYTGSAITPSFTVYNNGVEMQEGDDYTYSFVSNVNPGTSARLVLTGTGNYTGTRNTYFTISKRDIANATVSDISSMTYTGAQLKPSVSVTYGSDTLTTSNYTVTYGTNIDAGTGSVTITGKGSYYQGSKTIYFDIEPRAITYSSVGSMASYTYTGSAIKPTPAVTVNSRTLIAGTDFDYSYSNNTESGTGSVTITGKGNYTGVTSKNFTIARKTLSSSDITVAAIPDQVYDPLTPPVPDLTIKYGSVTLTKADDYSVVITGNTEAGTATVTITGNGNYTGSRSTTFKVLPRSIETSDFTVSSVSAYTWSGQVITPEPTVKYKTRVLAKDTDYTITYSGNKEPGTATVTITGNKNYTGTKTVTFTINRRTISGSGVTGIAGAKYTGSPITQDMTVKYSSDVLVAGTDYEVTYSANTVPGTATVTITGIGHYQGTVTKSFTISKRPMSETGIVLSSMEIWTGSAITPVPVITFGGLTLSEGNDYTVSYKDNVNLGTATVTITGKGNFTGTVTRSFEISATLDAPVDLMTGTMGTSTAAISWTGVAGADGYYIFARGENDGDYVLVKNVTEGDLVTVTGLSSATTYEFKVVAYKNAGDTVITSDEVYTSGTTKPLAATGASASAVSTTSVKLTWNEVDGADGYEISKALTGGTFTVTGTVTETSKTFTGLTAATGYDLRIRAYKEVDGVKIYGAYTTVTGITKPAASKITSSVRSGATGASFTIKWAEVPGATGYELLRSTSSNGTYTRVCTTTKLSRTDSGLTVGTTYYYKVRSYKIVNGKIEYSDYSAAKPILVPGIPGNFRIVSRTSSTIMLNWNKVAGQNVMYEVWRSRSPNSGYVCLGRYNVLYKESKFLSSKTTYYYKIRAYYYCYDTDGTLHRIYGDYAPIVIGKTT